MKIAFIDIAASYHAGTPYLAPLGGTQSAVCYLSAALVRRGYEVSLINQNREETTHEGVNTIAPERLDEEGFLEKCDALVFNGRFTEKLVTSLRKRTTAPFIMWMHEAAFNDPWILPLPAFSHIVFVSTWQQRMNAALLNPQQKSHVIPHGISPAFMAHHGAAPLWTKQDAARCVYIGGSKRGLFFLPEIIQAVRRIYPHVTFEIYSDGVVSFDEKENEENRKKFAALDGVTHMGAVAQNVLAHRLARAHYCISPNPYPETFCISLAEAMAAGLCCLTTARAALPETGAGFTHLVPIQNPDDHNYAPDHMDGPAFTTAFLKLLADPHVHNSEKALKQSAYAREHYQWDRAADLWIRQLLHSR